MYGSVPNTMSLWLTHRVVCVAAAGHHFAGYSNRFWKLLYESRLVPEPIGHEEDRRLPEWGFGITNLIPRPTPGIDTLRPEEYVAGLRALRRKVRRVKPEVVAFVGVTLFRFVFALRPGERTGDETRGRKSEVRSLKSDRLPTSDIRLSAKKPIALGLQTERFEGVRVFVLPNPSGRNANFSYKEMLEAFKGLGAWLRPT
jgi:double-stranded uracil-DNA glycosylase